MSFRKSRSASSALQWGRYQPGHEHERERPEPGKASLFSVVPTKRDIHTGLSAYVLVLIGTSSVLASLDSSLYRGPGCRSETNRRASGRVLIDLKVVRHRSYLRGSVDRLVEPASFSRGNQAREPIRACEMSCASEEPDWQTSPELDHMHESRIRPESLSAAGRRYV